jgi:hypothetical protein
MPVTGSVILDFFLRVSSALLYSVQIFALKLPCVDLEITFHAPSHKDNKLYLIAILPASAILSWSYLLNFLDTVALFPSPDPPSAIATAAGERDAITWVSSFSI